ncbi:hypothetical protein [Paraburkholderia phenazinium]|uniref:Uncharacterized protein n=1 Tax=Paraburkholderia phenazinium TaxID=60549 RepID=A0A1G7W7H8_9BURK|nr:hypothetical protein [Paraburkholderia phenazinium]SDG67944.1 hypothetical protein SAMN05216466_104438 [Paraburkholderia phenazinium]
MDKKKHVAGKGREVSTKELNKICRDLFCAVPFDFAEDATLLSDQPLMILIGQMQIRFHRPPKDWKAHTYMTEDAITEFFHRRDQWQRDLPHFRGPYVFQLGYEFTCSVEVRSRYALDHISVRRTRNDLNIVLPHPRKWIRVGLGWLFELPCPCGEPRCIPAPWRNTICRNGY